VSVDALQADIRQQIQRDLGGVPEKPRRRDVEPPGATSLAQRHPIAGVPRPLTRVPTGIEGAQALANAGRHDHERRAPRMAEPLVAADDHDVEARGVQRQPAARLGGIEHGEGSVSAGGRGHGVQVGHPAISRLDGRERHHISAVVDRVGKLLEPDRAHLVAGGGDVARQFLRAGLLDELQIHLAPVFLGAGVRLFEGMAPDSAGLVAEAQSFFIAKQYDRAEADYLKILQSDGNNALVLGNLAAIEMQEGKLDDAEKHIRAALAQDPNDAFNLATLGYLKFRQDKFDEALDVLSRAAKLDPQNPEIQNYLGVTLSHKGLRPQAEAALRKAIELNPDYAAAHNNLAAIYISATPPRVELARWHYQKALQAGQPHNPELEKALAEKGAPAAP